MSLRTLALLFLCFVAVGCRNRSTTSNYAACPTVVSSSPCPCPGTLPPPPPPIR